MCGKLAWSWAWLDLPKPQRRHQWYTSSNSPHHLKPLTKHSNTWAYGGHSSSSYHTHHQQELESHWLGWAFVAIEFSRTQSPQEVPMIIEDTSISLYHHDQKLYSILDQGVKAKDKTKTCNFSSYYLLIIDVVCEWSQMWDSRLQRHSIGGKKFS